MPSPFRARRLGVLVPSSNTTVETELRDTLPRAISLHVGRLPPTRIAPESIVDIVRTLEDESRKPATAGAKVVPPDRLPSRPPTAGPRPVHRRTVILAAAAALGSGCSGLKKKDQASRLDQSLSAYTDAIRWGNFGTAAGFTVPRSGRAPPLDPRVLEGLKVTGYTVRINRVNDGADEADVAIAFTYYHESRGTLRQVDQVATWYFHPDRGAWLLDGGLPAFQR